MVQTQAADPGPEVEPAGQGLQTPLMTSPEYSFTPQATQTEPCTTEPAAQHCPVVAQSPATQVVDPCSELFPPSHGVQVSDPLPLYFPPSQGGHMLYPTKPLVAVPAEQKMQAFVVVSQ